MTLAAKTTVIYHWEVSLTLTCFKDDSFTMMWLRKRQRSLDTDDTDLNVEKKSQNN